MLRFYHSLANTTSWSCLDKSELFLIALRKFGSTPEFAGENSPSTSLSSSEHSLMLSLDPAAGDEDDDDEGGG